MHSLLPFNKKETEVNTNSVGIDRRSIDELKNHEPEPVAFAWLEMRDDTFIVYEMENFSEYM